MPAKSETIGDEAIKTGRKQARIQRKDRKGAKIPRVKRPRAGSKKEFCRFARLHGEEPRKAHKVLLGACPRALDPGDLCAFAIFAPLRSLR